MVESTGNLDTVFASLSNPIRRDIIKRVSKGDLTVGAIAEQYKVSFAGIAKHIGVLERAGLIHKTRMGKEQSVSFEPLSLAVATEFLEEYRELWEERLDSLDSFLTSLNE